MKNVYHIVTHPDLKKSRVNKELLKAFEGKEGIVTRRLYEAYPDWNIHVEQEKQCLLDADIIVVQSPLYWYSTPGLFKEWQDKVLEYGFAYGEGGDKLRGKLFQLIFTTFGPETSYQHNGNNHFTMEEFLRPLQQTANLCQMSYLKPMYINGVMHKSDADISAFKDHVESEIEKLRMCF